MPNRFVPIGAESAPVDVIKAVNANFAQLDTEAITKVFKQASGYAVIEGKLPYDGGYGVLIYDRNGVPSIVSGILPDGTTGMKIAKPGINVLTATNDQLAFNSAQNTLKVVYTSPVVSIPSSGTDTSIVTIPHGLSFTPSMMGYGSLGGLYQPLPSIALNLPAGTVSAIVSMLVDATNVYLSAVYPGSTVPSGNSVKYYLLQETSN